MSAHTPFIPQALEACGHCVRTADGRGWLMAEVPATAEHASSYAQLFAAAPQLLEALKALLPLAEEALARPGLDHRILDAHAALALATGAAT